MLKESRWVTALSLLFCCLLNSQAYAVEDSKKNAASVTSIDAAAPASVAKPVIAENKSAPAKPSQNSTGNPAEAVKRSPEPADAKEQQETGSTISGAVAANGLQSLSVVESVLSLLLTAIFLLVLIRGKIIKHHE